MKICLKKTNNMLSSNEYNLIICADGGTGREIRRNLPKCICGDGIKINIIVTGCDGVLEARAIPCNNLFTISSPIKIIRRNPCCRNQSKSCCDDFDSNNLNFEIEDNYIDNCKADKERFIESVNQQEYAIIVRSFNPVISKCLCKFPQIYIEDCEKTVKLIIIFDKKGSVFEEESSNNCACGFGGNCGFGGCGFNGGCGFGGGCGCGCGGLFGIAALALLFCC
ncbi:hypothetical protein R0131_02365 [Clostridium sp. AL.422]|uniref:hypothetical protein n=1 Tax=Clostridium TaxID=1485 RepID=UPI00293DFCA1|nr:MULTISPECIES: hypothetical protein [unclassified Clostridium]MDV4149670.1 hypothetical protein [Clostridium sp. AL.422]